MQRHRRHAAAVVERSFWHYLGSALSGAVLVLVLAVAVVVIVVPRAAGGQALTVLTQSMEPGLPPGTLVVIRPENIDAIRVGEVLTYQIDSGRPGVVSHRVVSCTIASDGVTTFITKGDNNDVADPKPVMPVQIQGTLWYAVPWIGYVNTWITGDARGVVVPALAVALFGYAAFIIFSAWRDRRRAKEKPSEGDEQNALDDSDAVYVPDAGERL
ncbi:signal peptidase I [Subtercola frigoramans]|uniref:Signal peptidase I n=1 Tax=Subtercola frigoramans TaxID=120298 RepID=A0ABS2L7D0_9MICO|nr:signal peptidase I [Subtercola frigoramans]MBM7473005.1 signal peptidase [Subtercola frigoramans]